MLLNRWLVPDNVPEKADAICCLSYGLSWDKTRLAEQGLSCVIVSIYFYRIKKAPILIFSNAYEQYWQREAGHKNSLAINNSIPIEAVRHLVAVNHTYDEAAQIKEVLRTENAKTLILIADRWHMKRALDAFQQLMPEIKIYPYSVRPPKYEMA